MDRNDNSLRILILAPQGRDAALTADLLARAGFDPRVCITVEELCQEIRRGAGCAIVTEEVLHKSARAKMSEVLVDQPPWSDFPFVVFSARVSTLRGITKELGNVSFLDRPVKTRTLTTAVQAALRARQRQYEAQRAIEQRDQFLAMLGHELRNPLGAIVLASEVTKRGRVNGRRLGKHQEIIERQTRHLARLVDDLLDVSRVTSGKVVLRRELVDLHQLIRRCCESIRPRAEAQEIELADALCAEPAFVDGDAVRLDQVFTNLLTNAVKYSPAGSRILVKSTANDERILISIMDNGIGIDPKMLHRIFELFTQANSSLDRSQGGMGIGLTLVKRLIELHGGTIKAHSDGLGLGSEFTVWLPRAQPPIEAEAKGREPLEHWANGLSVVLVEDTEDLREASKEALQQMGYRVSAAHDGPSAVATIIETRPTVALVDIGLPGFDGYEVSRRVRAALGATVVLLALTGYGLPDDERRALAAGFDGHLVKPLTIDALDRAIARATRRHADANPASTPH